MYSRVWRHGISTLKYFIRLIIEVAVEFPNLAQETNQYDQEASQEKPCRHIEQHHLGSSCE